MDKTLKLYVFHYITNKKMYSRNDRGGSHQKRAAAQITKFNYHLQNTIP